MRRALLLTFAALIAIQPARAQDGRDVLAEAKRQASEAAARLAKLEAQRRDAKDAAELARLEWAAAAAGIEKAEASVAAATLEMEEADKLAKAERERLQKVQAPTAALVTALVALDRRPPLAMLIEGQGRADDLIRLEAMLNSLLPDVRSESRALAERLRVAKAAREDALAARGRAQAARAELAERRERFVEIEQAAEAKAENIDETLLGARSEAVLSADALADLNDVAERQKRAAREGAKIAAQPLSRPSPFLAERAPKAQREAIPMGYRLPALAAIDEGLGAVSQAGIRSRGVRLLTDKGTRLVAPAAGEIIFAGPFRSHDGLIAIDHGDGWISLIVDASPDVKRGDVVAAGENIGRALGPIRVELRQGKRNRSAALIAGSSH